MSIAAVALGATVIEKHFVLDRSEGGVDAEFSLEPAEMKQLVDETERAWTALGKVHYGVTDKEIASRKHRRSLYISADLAAGAVLTTENLRAIRPGLGLAPKYLELVLGRQVKADVKRGTALSWDLLL